MKALLALSIVAALAATGAQAQNAVQISGFGQIVAGSVIDGGRNPATGTVSFPAAAYDDSVDFQPESLFAVQARGEINEQWSATAQIVARGDEDFSPEFAWAFIGWDGGNGWSAKFGRQRLPLYRYSDFLEVGFAFPWLRVPTAVYNLDFSNYDGISIAYSIAHGDWFSSVQGIGGRLRDEVEFGSGVTADADLESLFGLAAETTYADWLTLRASYFRAEATLNIPALNPLFGALRANGFGNVAARLDFDADSSSFWGLGMEINHGNWLLIAERIGVESAGSFLSDRNEFYVTAGHRFGNLLPTVTYGRRNNDAKTDIPGLIPAVPALATLRGGVTQLVMSEAIDDTYWSYGLRWDFARNMAFKADYTRFTTETPGRVDADAVAAGLVFTF